MLEALPPIPKVLAHARGLEGWPDLRCRPWVGLCLFNRAAGFYDRTLPAQRPARASLGRVRVTVRFRDATDKAPTIWRSYVRELNTVMLADLCLDPENPRLPVSVQGSGQEELLEYIFENEVLDELAASFVANGYFYNEPVLVLPPDDNGKRTVVEGNRRVSTLKILLQDPLAVETGLQFDLTTVPTNERLQELTEVPAFEVENREELGAYLGFRHIGGLRQWSSEAKARWIHTNVASMVAEGRTNPFYDVGRIVGSNARGVRTAYLALELLRRARRDHGVTTSHVENYRYSVWGLLVGNSRVRDYIGLDGDARSYQEIDAALDVVDYERVGEIIGDLTPRRGSRLALLVDSRSVSRYVEVLSNERAHEVLREHEQLALAVAVLEQGDLTARLQSTSRLLREILVDAARVDVEEAAPAAAVEVLELARSVHAVVVARTTEP